MHAVVAVGGAMPAPRRMSRGSTGVSSGSTGVTAGGNSSTARRRRETLRFVR